MKRTFLLLASAFLTLTMTAQTFEWAKSIGGADLQEGHGITFDDDGNVYTSGYFRGTADFDPGASTFNLTSAGNNDVFISKLDASGNFVWARQFGGTGFDECFSVSVDATGNVYAVGRFEGTADFDPGAGVFNLISNGASDIFISKLDASGNFIWAKQFGGTNIDDAFGIALDASGNVYATGRFQQTVDFNPDLGTFNLTSAGNFDVFITKLDASGNFLWAKQLGGIDSDEGYSITLNDSGDLFTTGIFQGTADFDPGLGVFNLTSGGSNDVFISKLDASGNFVWAKRMGGAGNDIARSIAVDNSSNVHITGSFTGTADFDPGIGTFNLISSGSFDAFITKLDASGNFLWANKIGGTAEIQGFSIALDPSGNVYAIGDFRGSAGGGTFGYSSIGLSDIYIAKLDVTGNYAWIQRIGGGSDDKGYAIAVDANWSIYTTGYFRLGADFDPGSGSFNLFSAGAEDIFVHKMSQCISTTGTDTQTACYFYTWPLDNVTYYASTTSPTVTLINAAGCDSIVTLNLTIFSPPEPTGATSQSFCSGATVADLSATGNGIQWYATNFSGETPLPVGTALSNGATYYASQTGANCEGALLAVTVTVNSPSAPTGPTLQEFCDNATLGDLSASGTNIQWYNVATGGTALLSGTVLINGETYYASQTVSGCESSSRLPVTVTINTPTAPTGSNTQSLCNAATVADLTATGTGILWYATASGGSPLAVGTVLSNGSSYFASQTINGCESTSRFEVTVTINDPAAPTGSASQTFCNTGTIADLSATGTGILWYDAATSGNVLSAGAALVDGTTYYATQTVGGCESSATLAVAATVNSPAAPTGASSQSFCNAGTVTDLSVAGTGIQWYDAATSGNLLSAGTALIDGTTYYATQTVGGCESSATIAVTATLNTPAAPTGTATQAFCGSGLVSDLSVTGSNITWYDAATSGNVVTGASALVDGTTYYATQTVAGCESVNVLAVTATINAIPSAPTGSASQTFCNTGTIADLSATGIGIQWYTSATGGTALTSGTALTTGSYFASQTVNACESNDRTEVAVNIITPSTPTGDATQNFCSASTVADLTATGTAIQWYNQATGGTALAAGTALSNGTYYASQTINGCESQRLEVTVTVTVLDNTVTENGLTLTANQTGAAYTWVDCNNGNQPIAGATTQSYTASANGSYAVNVEQNGCSVTSNCVAITTVGLDDFQAGLFRIYPNPTSTVLHIELEKATGIRLLDVTGKLLLEEKGVAVYTIDVTHLTTGLYIIETAEGAKAKFVKQ